MAWLTGQIADAVCTAIVLGYVAIDGKKTKFQYAKDNDKEKYKKDIDDHAAVRCAFKAAGVVLDVSESEAQREMAYIIAKNPRVNDVQYAKTLTNEYRRYLNAILKSANNLQTAPPKGAYIGGISTIPSLHIIGPSELHQYRPKLRAPSDDDVKKSYKDATDAIKDCYKCIKADAPAAKPANITLNFANILEPKVPPPFQEGSLFSSYHGMVLALVHNQASVDTNSFVFEIALGNNTSKVSSCLACSMFMTAVGRPATSTHLGRADNWNIPVNCNKGPRDAWAEKIAAYYEEGKKRLGPNLLNDRDVLTRVPSTPRISEIFLEALTFEGGFTKKILETLRT